MSGKKKRKVFIIILLLIITLPLIIAGISFIGKVAPDSILPDSFELYISVPNPIRLLNLVLGHEHLADVLELAELTPYTPILNQLKNSGLAENNFLRFAARGKLDAVLLTDERFIAAWDTGILSPLLRLLPALAGRLGIPGLYHVRAGQNSHFEYRAEDGTVLFIGPYRNLLVFTNNPALYQSVIAGTSRDGGIIGAAAKSFSSRKYDIAFLLSPGALGNIFAGADPQITSAINLLQFPGPVELSLQFLPNQLRLRLISPLETGNQALQRIIERNSPAQPLLAMIPDTTQYLTLLSAGSLRELLDAASAISVRGSGTNWEGAIRRADSSARATLGMSLEDLLFSWSGTQFAVYGLEGRAHPVIAVEIRDENKRREVFDRAFSSIFVRENIQLVLDGNRIPRIEIPGFLNSLLSMMGADIPSPFYVVQNNYLFISESAETLIAAVNAVRRNQVLPRQELWRTLSEDNSGPASFSVFYSMDRSLPFFLRGSNTAAAVLRLYRQGLLRLYLENSVLNISLSVIPGAGRGLVPLAGFPLDLSARGRTGNQLYLISSGRDTRLLLTQGNNVLAVNPIDRNIRELNVPGSPGLGIYAIPAEDGAWVVNSQGQVSLVNIDLENLRGFPINTGIRLSAPPIAWGERLFLSAEDGSVYTVDDRASVNRWEGPSSPHSAPLPLSLISETQLLRAFIPKAFSVKSLYWTIMGSPLEAGRQLFRESPSARLCFSAPSSPIERNASLRLL